MNKENKKNIYQSMSAGFDQIHNTLEQSTPAFVQSLSNLQQEYFIVWKNIVSSNLSMQEKYAKKMGSSSESTKMTDQIIQKMTDEIVTNFKLQNNFMKTWLDTSKQNIHAINENSTSFSIINKKFIESLSNMVNVQK